ncbi:hypothetical protein XELAEV_18028024mg, partial [Xenopus laevis]
MEEYRDSTSQLTTYVPLSTLISDNLRSKSPVSFIYEGSEVTNLRNFVSMYLLACSQMLPLPDTMGRPGGLCRFLWIL